MVEWINGEKGGINGWMRGLGGEVDGWWLGWWDGWLGGSGGRRNGFDGTMGEWSGWDWWVGGMVEKERWKGCLDKLGGMG